MIEFEKLMKDLEVKYPNLKSNSDQNSQELADLVFSLRIRNKLSQKELADLAGVDVKLIHRIEGGSKIEGDDIYVKLLNVLKSITEETLIVKELGEKFFNTPK